jgi:hypothetical protein
MSIRSEVAAPRPATIGYAGVTHRVDGRHVGARPDVHLVHSADPMSDMSDRVADLEDALIRVAGLCSDRAAVMEIICSVIFDDSA